MNMKTDEELISYFSKTRQLQPSTERSYRTYIKQYSKFNNMSMIELLQEAEDEEEAGVRWKHRTLKKRLITFRAFLYENYAYETAKTRFGKLLAFYRHFEIEIHQLPKIATINAEKTHMGFKDLPDKEIIKKALKVSNHSIMRAIILFMSSSGCARTETLSLTVQQFIDATKEYHNSKDVYQVINTLKDREDVIPMWYLKRPKTNKYFYTFCSPEATKEIINYLASRTTKLKPESPLFKISEQMFILNFRNINGSLGLGKLENGRGKFTSHMLRKFHSTQLWNEGVSKELVDALQGRGKDQVHSSYFWENPEKLREIYIENLNCLTINLDVNQLDIKSPEYISLETELKEKDNALEDMNNRLSKVESLFNNVDKMSDDEILKLFAKRKVNEVKQ